MASRKRMAAALVAVLLAALGIGALVVYTNSAQDRAFRGTETVEVLRVTEKVPAGTPASELEKVVEQVKLPRASVPEDLVTSLEALGDKETTATLVAGEVLVGARFAGSAALKGSGAIEVPKGLQEVTVSVEATRAIDGTVQPGDRVGVLASYEPPRTDGYITNFVVNRALVLAVTGGVAGTDAAPGAVFQVRLALQPDMVERVVNATEFGKVYLSRQNNGAATGREVIDPGDVVQ